MRIPELDTLKGGERVLMTIDVVVRPRSDWDIENMLVRYADRKMIIPHDAIVSIERQRPELPGEWKWSGDLPCACLLVDGTMVAEVSIRAIHVYAEVGMCPVELAEVIGIVMMYAKQMEAGK